MTVAKCLLQMFLKQIENSRLNISTGISIVGLIFIFNNFTIYAQNKESTIVEELKYLSDFSLLPKYRQNTEVAMISSYDTTGGNDDGFSGKYSFIRKEDENSLVIADLQGPGVIQRIWTPTPTDDTIQFYFDGEEKPGISMKFEDLFSSKIFPFKPPLAGNELGGYFSYIPIPFEKSCKVVYKGDGLKFHQIQYRTYPKKQQVTSFSMDWSDDEKKALEKVAEAWTHYGGNHPTEELARRKEIKVLKKNISIGPGETISIAEINAGGRIIRMTFENGSQLEVENTDLIFRAKWDSESGDAINAPMASLFGYAFGKRSMTSVLIGSDGETNYCHLPMPFDDKAALELEYLAREDKFQPDLSFQAVVYYTDEKRDSKKEGKLYAVWRRETPKKQIPYTILKQQGRGHHIGTILLCQSLEKGDVVFTTAFFEGDDITTIDDEIRLHGTGSEDYFNGGWYGVADRWDGNVSLPLHGCLDYSIPLARTGAYRFYLGDKVSFNKSYELTIEHGYQNNEWAVDYSSIAFYYGDTPSQGAMAPSLELTKGFDPPEQLEIYLNFFNIQSLGFPFSPMALYYKRIEGKDVFAFHAEEDWLSVKTNLNVPVGGTYDLYISYFKSPESGALRLFQRQKPISEWIDISSDKFEFVERQLVGRIRIKSGDGSLTFKTKGEQGKCDFALHRMYLVEVKDE